jgi:hypothetical protein
VDEKAAKEDGKSDGGLLKQEQEIFLELFYPALARSL